MKKIIWIPLVILVVGIVFASVGYAAGGPKGVWIDRNGLQISDRGELVKVDESFSSFKDIKVDAAFLDRLILIEGDSYTVRGQSYTGWGGLEVDLKGDTLTVMANDKNGLSINFGVGELFRDFRNDAWLEITYPKRAALGDVDVKLSAGEVRINNLNCMSFLVDNSFGGIDISSVKCESLRITAKAGNIELANIDVKENALLINDFGNVELASLQADRFTATLSSGNMAAENISAESISISNNLGEIDIDGAEAESIELKLSSGNLKTDGVKTIDMEVRNSFGNVSLERIEFTGLCTVESNSGDVTLGLRMAEYDLSYSLNVNLGEIWIGDMKTNGSVTNRNADVSANLTVDSDFGNIRVKFVR